MGHGGRTIEPTCCKFNKEGFEEGGEQEKDDEKEWEDVEDDDWEDA